MDGYSADPICIEFASMHAHTSLCRWAFNLRPAKTYINVIWKKVKHACMHAENIVSWPWLLLRCPLTWLRAFFSPIPKLVPWIAVFFPERKPFAVPAATSLLHAWHSRHHFCFFFIILGFRSSNSWRWLFLSCKLPFSLLLGSVGCFFFLSHQTLLSQLFLLQLTL